jgi:hypothetical protein
LDHRVIDITPGYAAVAGHRCDRGAAIHPLGLAVRDLCGPGLRISAATRGLGASDDERDLATDLTETIA